MRESIGPAVVSNLAAMVFLVISGSPALAQRVPSACPAGGPGVTIDRNLGTVTQDNRGNVVANPVQANLSRVTVVWLIYRRCRLVGGMSEWKAECQALRDLRLGREREYDTARTIEREIQAMSGADRVAELGSARYVNLSDCT